jgi:hypothetical protein
MSPWLAPAPSLVTISRRRCFGDSAAIAASSTVRWSAVVLLPAEPGRSIPAQGVQAEPFEIRLRPGLARMAGHHDGVRPQAGHAVRHLVRDPHPGESAVAGLDRRPRTPPGRADSPGDSGLGPARPRWRSHPACATRSAPRPPAPNSSA